jgi:hypothetical protein
MLAQPRYLRVALMSAISAGLCLVGSLVLPFAIALVVGQLLGNSTNPPPALAITMVVLALLSLVGGSAAWGFALSRIAGAARPQRLALACALSYGPATVAAAFLLGRIEPIVVEGTPGLAIHWLFSLLFAPAVFFVAAATGAAIGLALRSGWLATTAALGGGAAAALGFLVVDLLLDSLGMRVGAPRAEESATMLKVLAIGDLGAALAGGATISVILARHIAARPGSLGARHTPAQTSSSP